MDAQGIEYKYVRIVNKGFHQDSGLKEVNALLRDGWFPVRECPFGAGGNYQTDQAILILLRRNMVKAEVVVTEVGDELDTQNQRENRTELAQSTAPSDLYP